jgi:uncharacterized protein (TIGR03437 family)
MRSVLVFVLLFPCGAQIATRPGVWETRAPLPIEATEVSSAALNGKIYTMCGITRSGNSDALFIYDPRTDAWSRGASIPIAGGADHCNVAAANGKIYLLGAIRIGSTFIDGNTYEYDPALNRWQTLASLGTPRGASGVAVVGARIYIAGGLTAAGSVSDFEMFDASAKLWFRLPGMPTRRDHLTAQAVNGKIYAIAGRSDRDLATNEEFDIATSTWRNRAPVPRARGGLASGVVEGRVIVFGGEGASGTPENTFRDTDEYNPATDTWTPLASLPTPRHGFYGATLDGRIFVPGGGPIAGANFSNAHEALYYVPEPRARLDGIGNAASFGAELAPGTMASAFGADLSLGEQVATRLPLPSQMNGVRVRAGGRDMGLVFVSPNQINFAIPADLPTGPTSLELSNAGRTIGTAQVELAQTAPAVFTLNSSGQGPGAVLIAGTGLLAQTSPGGRPVRRGEAIEIYCTGLGREPVQAAVTIGGQIAEVLYAGRSGVGPEGLSQVNVRVPQSAPIGAEVQLVLQVGGRISREVTIAVAQ